MTDTITIRPTPARDIKPGDRIRARGATETVTDNRRITRGFRGIDTAGGPTPSYTVKDDYLVDVVVGTPTDPEPEEPTWPTAPLIRITKTSYDWDNIPASGLLALRTGGGNYLDADDVDYFQKDAAIVEWEDLTPIRTDLIKDLAAAHMLVRTFEDDELSPHVTRLYRAAALLIVDADRSQP